MISLRRSGACLLALVFMAGIFSAKAVAQSTTTANPLTVVELFTSQGCSSCPPADAYLGELAQQKSILALSIHVDYWDYIGWNDRFAQPAFSQRQRAAAARNSASFVYTPQFVFDGRDFRNPWAAGRLSEKLQSFNNRSAPLKMSLQHSTSAETVRVSLKISNTAAQSAHVYLALFENGLHSAVKAGENAGKKLYHDYVVRELTDAGMVASGKTLTRQFVIDLPSNSDPRRLGLAAFAEDPVSGAIMQAMAVALCDG